MYSRWAFGCFINQLYITTWIKKKKKKSKTKGKVGFDPGSAALEADNLPLGQRNGSLDK